MFRLLLKNNKISIKRMKVIELSQEFKGTQKVTSTRNKKIKVVRKIINKKDRSQNNKMEGQRDKENQLFYFNKPSSRNETR
jgi:hypothetical protein